MNKVDSSSLASFTSPLYRLTTPAAREEQGTSLYLRYNIPPHAPRAGSAKEATSGVFAGPAWPDFASPAVASLGAIPPRPPVAARAAGEAAGLNGIENRMDLNVPEPGPVATSQRADPQPARVGEVCQRRRLWLELLSSGGGRRGCQSSACALWDVRRAPEGTSALLSLKLAYVLS